VKYLFDTDTLSELLRRAPRPALLRRLAATPLEEQTTSSITVGELLYGAFRLPERAADLAGRIERLILPNVRVLPFDTEAARRYGALRAELERRGTPIGDADMRIASIALSNQLTIVTGNLRHFQRVPDVAVENWIA
jgi:tRNA(fMet)-specific endonuclease VapC